jgi:hypothetical protein
MKSVVCGAKMKSTTAAAPITATASVRIVWPNSTAARSSSRFSPRKIGMNGAARPLAISTSSVSSGSTKAAL